MTITELIILLINVLPQITLLLFFVLTITSILKKNWKYFYIGLLLIVFCIQFIIVVNAFSQALGIESRGTYSKLPYQKFWAIVTLSLYFYSCLGLVGLIVSGVRKFLKLKTKRLFIISLCLVVLGLILYFLNSSLSCNYSPTDPCKELLNRPMIPSINN